MVGRLKRCPLHAACAARSQQTRRNLPFSVSRAVACTADGIDLHPIQVEARISGKWVNGTAEALEQ